MAKPTKRNSPRAESAPGRSPPARIGGLVRSRDLEAAGTSRVALSRMVQAGQLQQIGRGLYAPAGFEPTEHHGLAAAVARVPGAVVCLLSALQFHGLGTQAPFEVWIAIDRKARKPAGGGPPLRIVRFSGPACREGVDRHHIEGITVPITSAARTIADCFRYRNKIGLDVALEALREYRRSRRSLDELTRAAVVMRVVNVIRPYLEGMLA
jgi:predicted transcriptional regulator of viral defense system